MSPTTEPLVPETSLLGSFLENLAWLPLRVLQFPLGPLALAGLATYVSFSAFPIQSADWRDPLLHYTKWLAITMGGAAALAFFLWRVPEHRFGANVLLSSNYARQVLMVAMAWEIVAGVFVLRSLGPWIGLAHNLFENTGAGAEFWTDGLSSGLAAFVAVAIYFCPGALALAAVAPIAVGLAVLVAALRRSRALPRVLLIGALVQSAYWGGGVLSLNLLQDILRPVLQRMETVGVQETLRERPEMLQGIDPEKDRALLLYLTQPTKTGRPVGNQLGWLLVAPWILVPTVFLRGRKEVKVDPSARPTAFGP